MAYKVSSIESKKIKSFEDLVAWQVGHELVLDIYRITKSFPKEEKYALTIQMRRASISITSNIAEGFSRTTKDGKNQFYTMALGSLAELHSQVKVALDIGYLDPDEAQKIVINRIRLNKLINGLIKSSTSKLKIPNTPYHIPNTENSHE